MCVKECGKLLRVFHTLFPHKGEPFVAPLVSVCRCLDLVKTKVTGQYYPVTFVVM